MAMMIDQHPAWTARAKFSILGTDVSRAMIEKAKSGIYTNFEIQRGLPQRYLETYFKQDGPIWRIDRSIAAKATFTRFNLLEDFSRFGSFDIIFCRNLLIYFDEIQKRSMLSRLSSRLAKDGYLVLGAAETVIGLSNAFEHHPTEKALYHPSARLDAPPMRMVSGL